MKISDCDAVILAGGKGTRIKHMLEPGQPKAMANINGKPFIKLLIERLNASGFEKFTLCVGYGQDQIVEAVTKDELAMFFCEHEQFGTGGALRMMLRSPAISLSSPFFLFNGDTICEQVPYARALVLHEWSNKALTALRYKNTNIGTFIMSLAIRTALEWESRERFNLEELPIHSSVNFFEVGEPFLDIGTCAGLMDARERYK